MNRTSETTLWVTLFSALFLGILWQFYPLPDAEERFQNLPLKGVYYDGYNVALTPFEDNFFQKVNIIKRYYEIQKQKFFVTILDGTHNRHVVHDPYYCLTGSGWKLTDKNEFKLDNGNAIQIKLAKGDQQREALFWFSDGNTQYGSPFRYWIQTTLRRISLGATGEEPVLIMIQPIETTEVDWENVKKDFPQLFKM